MAVRPVGAGVRAIAPARGGRGSTWLLQAAVGCALLIPSTGSALPVWNLAKLGLAVIGIAHLLMNHPNLRPNRTTLWVAVLFASPLLSLQLTDVGQLLGALASLGFAVAVALAVQSTPAPDYLRVLRASVVLIAVTSLLGLAQLATGGFPAWGYQGNRVTAVIGSNELLAGLGVGRAVASFGHPVPFGMVCAIGIALVASASLALRWWARAGLGLVITAGLLASGTRSAALAAAVGVVAALVLGRASAGRRPLRLVVIVLAAGVTAVLLNRYFGISDSLEGSFSLTHRVNSLTGGLRLLERPVIEVLLGSGPEGAARAFTGGFITEDGSLAIDNQLVWSFAVGGLLQVVALVVLLGRAVAALAPLGSDLALLFGVMVFSFDFLAWNATMTLFILLVQSPWLTRRGVPAADRSPPRQLERAGRGVAWRG